jgi:hypothetical protein
VPTPPASDAPDDRTVLEPIRVLRPRNTDALAQLLDEIRQDKNYRTHAAVTVPVPPPGSLRDRPFNSSTTLSSRDDRI